MEETSESAAPPPLLTLGEVRRELQELLKQTRRYELDHRVAGVLVNGYGVLAKIIADCRDSKWTARTREMWENFQRNKPKPEPAQNAKH